MIRTISIDNVIGDHGVNIKFAQQVASFRAQRGYGQKTFADKLGVSKKVIVRLEQLGGAATVGDYLLICLCLDIKVVDYWRYLLSDESNPLAQVEQPIRPKNLYGLHVDYQQLKYHQVCSEIEQRLASLLAELRQDCDKTMDQIVAGMGRSYRSFINKIEDGTRVLRLSEFDAYCNVLQVKSEAVIAEMIKQMESHRLSACVQ